MSRYPLRTNTNGKLLTGLVYNTVTADVTTPEYVVLVMPNRVLAHFQIKHRPTGTYGWDFDGDLSPTTLQALLEYCKITAPFSINLVTRMFEAYRTELPPCINTRTLQPDTEESLLTLV